jgi:CheY-like chemotaxis protein
VGKGTTLGFKLTLLLDATRAEEARLEEIASLHLLAGALDERPKPRVLIADDNEINRMVAASLLTPYGYQIAVAQNGMEAVELAKNGNFAVILMDGQMPGMDGFQATALIRQNEAGGKRTPIIALTAGVAAEQRRLCFAAGMDDFLAKPINPKLFQETMSKWIDVPIAYV